jgi:sarcosine oxidase
MPNSNASSASICYDVIVAGVGSVGSAACCHLARRGAKVLGLEQFEIPHTNGSHHGRSRMIRQAYFEHPDYVPLLRRAYQLWEELESAGDDKFFLITGGIYIGAADGTIVPGSLRAAREHDLDHALLSRDEIRERYPVIRPGARQVGLFEDRGGFLVPEAVVAAYADAGRNFGATLNTGETLLSWKADAGRVEVITDKATYTAGHLVITSGAWSAAAAQDLGIELQVTRQVLAWFEPIGDPNRFAPGSFPCWFVESESCRF